MEVARIEGRQRFWGDGDIMEEGGTEKSIDSGAAEKCEGFYEDGSGVRRYIDADTS